MTLEVENQETNQEVIEQVEEVTNESQDNQEQQDDDLDIISIGEEENETDKEEKEAEAKAPEWVRNLRKTTREQQKRIKELEQEVAKRNQTQNQEFDEQLPPKPNMADDGIDYDQDKYDEAMEQWRSKKQAIENRKKEAQQAQEQAQQEWQAQVQGYEEKKKQLKVKDFDEAEDNVKNTLNVVQQAIIIKGAANPEQVIYALGKNPSKAKELANINDPIKFAFAVANLERGIVVKKREVPKPETTVKSSAASSTAVEYQLDRLREEARKTGDMSKLLDFKRKNGIK